ncbi:uncharacterized protein LOC119314257 [Triticum dicoccoides]|uniref:uncharacterized protein LOC119314257 n=1 Tax=Triticum dicoccoides TaxID=85692 RepID=UPI0018916808|nr:uncharacterized protein LOC119314257 [Triticum dicoccoides]
MDGNKTAARPASLRAFYIARATVVVFALATAADYVLDRYHLCSSQSQASFILPCVRATAAAAAEWRALWLAMLFCAVLEAAVAALALRLPCRQRALAYLHRALTIVCHYMYVRAARIFLAADPGVYLTGICIGSACNFITDDVFSFMGLFRFGGEV